MAKNDKSSPNMPKKVLNFLRNRYQLLITSAFFLIFFIVGVAIFDDYGLSWDEPISRHCGTINVNYIEKGDRQLFIDNEIYHGPAFEISLIYAERLLDIDDIRNVYLIRHFVTFSVFFLSVFVFYKLCKKIFSSWALALLGSVFLILTPRIFAHSFFNSKDLVFMSFYIFAVATLLRFISSPTPKNAIIHALVSAFLVDIRMTGIVIPALTMFILPVDFIFTTNSRSEKKKKFISLIVYLLITGIFTMAFFPVIWENPIKHFYWAFLEMSRYHWNDTVLYLGKDIPATNLPWHYIPVWMLITIPVSYTFFFLAGCVALFRSTIKSRANLLIDKEQEIKVMLLFLFFFPLLSVIFLKSVLYDDWRHMYFIYPVFLLIALYGLKNIILLVQENKHLKILKFSVILLFMGCMLDLGFVLYFMVTSHPYQNVYFNPIAGSSVKNNFELDYWGLSYRQGFEYLLKKNPKQAIKVAVENYPGEIAPFMLTPTERQRVQIVPRKEADYFITNFRFAKSDYSELNEYYAIYVGKNKILAVYKIK